MTESNTTTSWWLVAQRASYSEFYGYAAREFPRMRPNAHIVDATQAKNAAERRRNPNQHVHVGVPVNRAL